jgi:hypothetical protein
MGEMEKLTAFTPHSACFTLLASVQAIGQKLHFRYDLRDPAREVLGGPTPFSGGSLSREDGLWQRTCFEAFFSEVGEQSYWELNMAPDGSGWNLYRFEGYRLPQQPQRSQDFALEKLALIDGVLDFWLVPERATTPLELSLCAVVKTAADTHYFALAHAGAKADFHLRSSFSWKLPGLTVTAG